MLAFSADPFVRWLFPDPYDFLTYFTRAARLHGERTSAHGGAYALSDGRGAAFWYPPGVNTDREALSVVFDEAGVMDKVAGAFGEAAVYEPSEPYWYLRQLGVDPALQRSGHGSELMTAALSEIDAQGKSAYLEATNVAARTFYERHGFETLGEVRVGDSPPLWPMLRTNE